LAFIVSGSSGQRVGNFSTGTSILGARDECDSVGIVDSITPLWLRKRYKDTQTTAISSIGVLWSEEFDMNLYFCKYRIMSVTSSKKNIENVAKYADMLAAMGTEPRLRIMQLLLSAHPDGLVVGDIQTELDIPNSTLSHHLEKLKNEGLVTVRRESTFLRYAAKAEALRELLQFLYAECCTRNQAVKLQDVVQISK
jgi:ArsR family transcriptional regulator, arsenate/arsenite/antimonite-responsive transcriptional repressor